MDTSDPTMAGRVARRATLPNWSVQRDDAVPQAARDLLYARDLLAVAVPDGITGPFANPAPIVGADFSLTLAVCPPGQGPGLHAHRRTTETFTCLRGRFRVYWGDEGEHETALEELDTISVPPGVYRGFQNVGDEEGILQVLITGGIHDMNDIVLHRTIAEGLAEFGPEVVAAIRATGLTFADDAGAGEGDEER